MKVAVIAGTPIDTEFGENILKEAGYKDIIGIAVSNNPVEQTIFQAASDEYKELHINKILLSLKNKSCSNLFVYCNSLSGAVDFKKLAKKNAINVVTPLNVYEDMANKFNKVAVLAANAQGLAGIEKVMMTKNPNLVFIGFTFLEMVKSIEKKEDISKIARDFKFKELTELIELYKVEKIILGCTHFPYIEKELAKYTNIDILNPAKYMLTKLKER
ncbi:MULTISPECIES: aspartate/glutamate racemase family protein [unclassified Gemella]|uniref:aspartate/glutamate racemase family protein n=1 Tax=unclassified Gemella TaxID=2624949 RepID=UPI001C042376|nr:MULTISPECIES: aspartate/glutamate racemase family protein [unclassified Gemella]MBU0278101.1 aspartate/glutamate racemase family protein [Gemella sp. zg-1178]QWQ38372.1 aspartate/glutamate racemase family protein [Gemella sp. zg-570]